MTQTHLHVTAIEAQKIKEIPLCDHVGKTNSSREPQVRGSGSEVRWDLSITPPAVISTAQTRQRSQTAETEQQGLCFWKNDRLFLSVQFEMLV